MKTLQHHNIKYTALLKGWIKYFSYTIEWVLKWFYEPKVWGMTFLKPWTNMWPLSIESLEADSDSQLRCLTVQYLHNNVKHHHMIPATISCLYISMNNTVTNNHTFLFILKCCKTVIHVKIYITAHHSSLTWL